MASFVGVWVYVYIWQTETPIAQALVTVAGYPSVLTNASGVAIVPNVAAEQAHTITTQKSGYVTDVRSPYISDQDYSTTVYLQPGGIVPTHTLTVQASAGGTTSPPPGTYTADEGSVFSVEAVSETGWFDHWELDGINIGSANPYDVVMDIDHTLNAVFVQEETLPTFIPSIDLPTAGGIILALTDAVLLGWAFTSQFGIRFD